MLQQDPLPHTWPQSTCITHSLGFVLNFDLFWDLLISLHETDFNLGCLMLAANLQRPPLLVIGYLHPTTMPLVPSECISQSSIMQIHFGRRVNQFSGS